MIETLASINKAIAAQPGSKLIADWLTGRTLIFGFLRFWGIDTARQL